VYPRVDLVLRSVLSSLPIKVWSTNVTREVLYDTQMLDGTLKPLNVIINVTKNHVAL